MSGGKGKLTDGEFGQAFLPYHDVNATESNWLAWLFLSFIPRLRKLDVYFKFDGDKLIESISVNVLRQKLGGEYFHVASYIYSKVVVSLLKEDNITLVSRHTNHTTSPREIGIYTLPMPIQSCKPARIVETEFSLHDMGVFFILGEVQFDGESGM